MIDNYDQKYMNAETLYKFIDKYGVEISAYLNAVRNIVIYWVSDAPHFHSRGRDKEGIKQHITLQNFTFKLNEEGWTHTN